MTEPTEAERRLAEIVAENARLQARVAELLAANNSALDQNRKIAGQNEKLIAGLDAHQRKIAELRSNLDDARSETDSAWEIILRQYGLMNRLIDVAINLIPPEELQEPPHKPLPEWRFEKTPSGGVEAIAPKGALLEYGGWQKPQNLPEGAIYEWVGPKRSGNGFFKNQSQPGCTWPGEILVREVKIVGVIE